MTMQKGDVAIPAHLLSEVHASTGLTPEPSQYGTTATVALAGITNTKHRKAAVAELKDAIKPLGLTAFLPSTRKSTVEIAPLWHDYLTQLPKYRNQQSGHWRLYQQRLDRHRPVMSYNPLTNSFIYIQHTRATVHILQQQDDDESTTWMTNTDLELSTMSPQIEAAHGRVLVAGLGMGIYTHLVSRKENVASVTVLEPEAAVISLIEPIIRNPKLTVVQTTLAEYCANTPPDRPYDYCFVDIWPYIADSYVHEAEVKQLIAPLLTDDGVVEVWCQQINDRKRASMQAFAEAKGPLDLSITTEPCYLCVSDLRCDIAGLCLNCAGSTWAETLEMQGRRFPFWETFQKLAETRDAINRHVDLTVVTA